MCGRGSLPGGMCSATHLTDARPTLDLPALMKDLAELTAELAHELDPCGPFAIDQVHTVVRRYADLLESAIKGSGVENARRIAELSARAKELKKGEG